MTNDIKWATLWALACTFILLGTVFKI